MNAKNTERKIDDVYKIKNNTYVYQKRFYEEIEPSQKFEHENNGREVICLKQKYYVLKKVWKMSKEDKINIINKHIEKINLKKWEDMALKPVGTESQKKIMTPEDELDRLSTFLLIGENLSDIVDLNTFRKIKKDIVKTPIEGAKRNKKVRYSMMNFTNENSFLLDKKIYNEWQKENICKNYKNYKKENKQDLIKPLILSLSKRKKQILECVAKGMPVKDISLALGLGKATISIHIKQIKEKAHELNQKPNSLFLYRSISGHMGNVDKDFTRHFRSYVKEVYYRGFDMYKFTDICSLFLDDIEKRKIYAAIKCKYPISQKLFNKMRNNINRHIQILKPSTKKKRVLKPPENPWAFTSRKI